MWKFCVGVTKATLFRTRSSSPTLPPPGAAPSRIAPHGSSARQSPPPTRPQFGADPALPPAARRFPLNVPASFEDIALLPGRQSKLWWHSQTRAPHFSPPLREVG